MREIVIVVCPDCGWSGRRVNDPPRKAAVVKVCPRCAKKKSYVCPKKIEKE